MPLAAEWTDEKNASIDWANEEEILRNSFTFLQLLAAHPRLYAYYATPSHQAERATAKESILRGTEADKLIWISKWQREQLFSGRAERWCRCCGASGHVRLRCPTRATSPQNPASSADTHEKHYNHRDAEEGEGETAKEKERIASASFEAEEDNNVGQASGALTVRQKYRAHLQRVERRRILEERQKPRHEATAVRHGWQANTAAVRSTNTAVATPATMFAAEDRRRGTVSRLDETNNIGFITVAGMGELKFFLDRVDVGVKTVVVGDAVTFKLDASRDYPIAIDVRHERPVISLDDVRRFLSRCRAARHPIRVMATILMHAHEWVVLLRWMQVLRDQEPGTYMDAVQTLMELTTFVGNREPIHVPVLGAFLRLMWTTAPGLSGIAARPAGAATTTSSSSASPQPAPMLSTPAAAGAAPVRFYPDMVREALQLNATALQRNDVAKMSERLMEDRWIEAGYFVLLMGHYAPTGSSSSNGGSMETPAVDRDAVVALLLQDFFAARLATATGLAARRLRSLQHALAEQTLAPVGARVERREQVGPESLALIPTAAELSVPSPAPTSIFTATNLPVNGAVTYTTTDAFLHDQRVLLRADTFEAVSRLLPAMCYSLPHYNPTPETLADVQHARLYTGVRCLGKVMARDRDYSRPESYLLEVHAQSAKADMRAQLHEGTTVCISTGLDPMQMLADELFWGVVSSCDATLMRLNVIVVAPCDGSASFERMQAAMDRNAAAGRSDRSLLLETPIFMAGYESIMRALEAFCGPLAMPLPLVGHLVSHEAAIAAAASNVSALSSTAETAPVPSLDGAGSLMEYIPPHCAVAFHEITTDIQSRFTFDDGQSAVMRQLPTSPLILVQGPPGTGKSFIGCRVVEAYVRYKQLVASGDILQKVSIDMLRSTRMEELLPRVGPMVVITYKNHALDEFLLDLLDSGLWEGNRPRVGQELAAGVSVMAAATGLTANPGTFPGGKRLVRIGGRSRESALDGYNLGSLMHGSTDRATLNSLKERLYVLNQRLDRLTKEIHYLENGKVPRVYFERWLTAEQRKHMSYDDREAWLAGERFVGMVDNADSGITSTHFQDLLRTRMDTLLRAQPQQRQQQKGTSFGPSVTFTSARAAPVATADADAAAAEEDVSLSVFQEMRREEERREFNNTLHETYVSTEALQLASHPPSPPAEVPAELMSLWSLSPRLRHEYYAFLIANAISAKARDCQTIMETMKSVIRVRRHATEELKLSLLRGADVVGLTTTGCAMNQNLLRSLRPSVLVVEEAAEVLESQLLACMTDSLKQIILIGDHYQLQPKVDTFQYEKINKLNLSLFERLTNKLQPIRLTEQRRMHPDISRLIRPFYTPQPLIDHASLLTRPFPAASTTMSKAALFERVPGLAQRVFFWRHNHPEEEAPGSRSKVNTREIRMVQLVVAHLAAQGVLQKSITVITPYLGQCRMLRGVLRLRSLADVRVSTVDLYQGDENDVVILSLVRTEKLTDFIKTRNRLIVSCSRARFGMVMVGNDALLRQCQHWEAVLQQLEVDQHIGDRLPIVYREQPSKVSYLQVTDNVSAAALEAEVNAAKVLIPAVAAGAASGGAPQSPQEENGDGKIGEEVDERDMVGEGEEEGEVGSDEGE